MNKNVTRKLLLVIICIIYINSFQQEKKREKLVYERERILKEIELTNKLIESTRVKKKNTVNELKLVQTKIRNRNKLISQLNNEINLIDNEISKNEETLTLLEKDLKKTKNEYATLIYYAFKNRNSELNFMYLFASKDVNQFYARYKYLQQYKDYRLKQIKLIIVLNKAIEDKISELNIKRGKKIDLVNTKLFERANLHTERENNDNIIKRLQQQEEELLKELENKKRIAEKLNKEIEDLIKREARRNKFEELTPEEKIISTNFESNKGRLPWPTTQGIITEGFGEHAHPVLKNVKVRNNGIDISTIKNSEVRAIFNGVVSKVFTIKGANSTVIVQHGSFFTVYHNLINTKVKVGDKVQTKQVIGNVYTDSKNGESVIHLEIWRELEKQNPELWLSN
ncbi:MAG: peptidoglycan DD-metalloendopeptidase family protein [Bacteroidales bacterium]|nr:peptidoglycan DD-metalloendopeptidase family protein [Bacteroidales bacterium]